MPMCADICHGLQPHTIGCTEWFDQMHMFERHCNNPYGPLHNEIDYEPLDLSFLIK